MKALVIDCAISKLSIAAKNEDKVCVTSYDIGMKQSEILVSAIDYVKLRNLLAKYTSSQCNCCN